MSFLKVIIFFILVPIFVSCSLLKSTPKKDFELLSGETTIENMTKNQIENELSIYESLAMNTFKVKIYPVIPAYIEKFKKVDQLLSKIPDTKDKTCFIAEITSDSYNPKAIDFKTWKAEGLDHQDDLIQMDWTKESLTSTPTSSTIPSYHGTMKRYFNRGVLCAVDKIETARYFQVKLSPQIVQWPLKGDLKFDWRVPHKTIENGEVVIKRRKKKIDQYKGW